MTNSSPCSTPRLVSIDRRQILLRAVDVEKLIDADHSARSLWELVGRLDLTVYGIRCLGRHTRTPLA